MKADQEKIEKKVSSLAWTKADFLTNNEEVPYSLLEDDLHTEGELMSLNEITEWIQDTEKTFYIISQENSELFDKLYEEYVIDIHYLVELGKIEPEEGSQLLNKSRFRE